MITSAVKLENIVLNCLLFVLSKSSKVTWAKLNLCFKHDSTQYCVWHYRKNVHPYQLQLFLRWVMIKH